MCCVSKPSPFLMPGRNVYALFVLLILYILLIVGFTVKCRNAVLCAVGWCTEVGRDGEAISFADGKTPVPIWEPHLCVLDFNTKRLLHFRNEKVNITT